jgi:DNA polymerase-3 subunit delta
LLDGICERRTRETLPLIESLRGAAELLQIVSALHNRLRCAMYMAEFPGESAAFVKAFGASPYAARLAEKAARSYGREKLLKCVAGLIRINANEKSGAGASWHDLSILIIELMS